MSELIKRLLGMHDEGPAAQARASGPANDDPATDAELTGLYDSVLSGWFLKDSGELVRGMPIGPEDTVVDVGCGEGGVLGFCARLGAHVVAIDMHPETLEVARRNLSATPARKAEFHCARADRIPVADASTTRAICTEVLEHVEDPDRVLAELVRIGQPGALYLFSVPGELSEDLIRRVGSENYFRAPNHVRVFGEGALEALIAKHGLEVVSSQGIGFFWSIWWALYWGCTPDLSHPRHPTLDHWTLAWRELVDSETGLALKHKLDEFMPKSRVVLARKP